MIMILIYAIFILVTFVVLLLGFSFMKKREQVSRIFFRKLPTFQTKGDTHQMQKKTL